MAAYYNEIDPFAAAWLRNLIAARLIPDGEVDERSILDVDAGDLRSFRQCHFFAGIGGWPHVLALAGWPDDRPVWTGSCPCQPFSSAGKQGGAADERHLWPRWLRLISECRPDTIFGEQVEGAVGFGWIDRVFADLEAEGYACGTAVLGAHSVGAPHIRQRLFWVANTAENGWRPRHGDEREPKSRAVLADDGSATGGLGNATGERRGGLGKPEHATKQGAQRLQLDRPSAGGFWDGAVWLPCLDGKARRVEPTIQPLAYGIPNRVGLLRGSGNAIVPQVAAQFVAAVIELA